MDSQNALNQLQQAQQTAINPQQYLQQAQQQYGVQGAQDTVKGLRGAITNTTKMLENVAPSVMGRTANSLVTSAQANRIIGNEQAPIAKQLQDQGLQYGTAADDLSRAEQQAAQAADLGYRGQQDKLSYLQNLYNTIYQREQQEIDRQEQIRQFNESLRRSGGGSGGVSPSLGGAAGSLAGKSSQYKATTDSSGGTQFTLDGQPITAAKYFSARGGNYQDVVNFLRQDKTSQQAYKDATSGKFSKDQLVKKYPYIFGGV